MVLLLAQFLAQLLLIPQGTLFGQVMFVATLIPSWMYHSYLSSLSLDFQTRTLFKKLRLEEDEDIHRYQLNTWTEAVVFTCLALALVRHTSQSDCDVDNFKKSIGGLLDGLLPNKTAVWQKWKSWLATEIVNINSRDEETLGDNGVDSKAPSLQCEGAGGARARGIPVNCKAPALELGYLFKGPCEPLAVAASLDCALRRAASQSA